MKASHESKIEAFFHDKKKQDRNFHLKKINLRSKKFQLNKKYVFY